MTIRLDSQGQSSFYKSLVNQIDTAIHDGTIRPGEMLPSMNGLAASLGISRETVKKAYGILTKRGLIVPRHGKGFYAADMAKSSRPQVLVIFDKLSVYKQPLFNAFSERLGDEAEITILTHNQSVGLLRYYLDENLDRFDYYVVMPHFPLDAATQESAIKQISRIPNRKLIMLDRLQPGYKGILEPTPDATPVSPGEIELALIPGVAFAGERGAFSRLGRGKGFYDRLLPSLRCPKVGICYPFRLVDSLPTDPWDIPLDGLIF